jgi:acetylornithine deacetylase/succinyl-diaminopimelate desuccinylase-like protein
LALAAGPVQAQQTSVDYTEAYQQHALQVYRTLIAFRTAAGHGQVPAAAAYLAEEFRNGGFSGADIHVLPLITQEGEETASLVVRYRGDGSSGERPVLFTAHMDVVDALPEDWERSPFALVEEDGYFFGRGTSDDKFGVAQLTATFIRLKKEGFVPTRDLIVAFTGDEETGMQTAQALVGEHRALTDAEFALNADGGGGVLDEGEEPESYLIQAAEKTYATFELTVTNPGGHSSTPRTDNAIYDLAGALQRLESHRFPVRMNDATRSYFLATADLRDGEVGQAMRRLAEDPTDAEAAEVLWHEPGEVGITRTTCIATMLRAGHAENALPQSATATVNCRIFPGVEVAEVEAELRRVVENPAVQFQVLDTPLASPASPLRDDVLGAVAAGVARIRPGTPIIPYMAPYGTDGLHIRRGGIPTYGVMGLFMRDSDRFEHGLNERVPVQSFFDALEFWHAVINELAGRVAA